MGKSIAWMIHLKLTTIKTKNGKIGCSSNSKNQKSACGNDFYYGTVNLKEFLKSEERCCESCSTIASNLMDQMKKIHEKHI